jgi:hypothetical protein
LGARSPWRRLGALSALGLAVACVTDHGALKKKPDSAGGGSGGQAGSSGGFGNVAGSGGQSGSGGQGGGAEPPGDNVLTLLHGAVDAESIVFCFARFDPDSGAVTHAGSPVPEGGLRFGRRASFAELAGLDFAADSLQPFVIAGDLDLLEGLSCEQAVAEAEAEELDPQALGPGGAGGAPGEGGAPGSAGTGEGGATDGGAAGAPGAAGQGGAPPEVPPLPPRLRVRALPVLPKGTLAGGRSYLFVAAGCFGGPAFTDPIDEAICGAGYAADAPTLTPVLVTLSRLTEFGEVGVQVVHASLATPEFDLSATPPANSGDFPISLGTNVTLGEVSPRPPRFGFSKIELGANTSTWSVDILMEGMKKSEFWPTIITRGGIEELLDGQTYALVVVGPRADINGFSWWNQAVISAVPTEPP